MDRAQNDAWAWLEKAFPDSPGNRDIPTRALIHLEESIELAQSVGISKEKVYQQVERTYSRPPGEPLQEAAGSLFTLLLCFTAMGTYAKQEFYKELHSATARIPEIREKSKTKVKL